jgi:hypothetical protein
MLPAIPRVLSADLQRQSCRRSSECHHHRLGRRRRRKAVFAEGADNVVPANISDVPRLVTSGRLPIDIVLLQVSGPDDTGRYNAGLGIEHLQAAIGRARLVIAQMFLDPRCSKSNARASRVTAPALKVAAEELLERDALSRESSSSLDPKWSTKQLMALGPAQMTPSCSSAAMSAADNPSQSP